MPPYMNPVNDFYFRQSQPYQQQFNFPPQQPALPPVNCKFVTNIEEAKAAMIDGISYNIFLDSSCGKIYLKKLGNNGVSDFIVYAIEENKPEVKTDPFNEINSRLARIENIIGGLNESISSNASVQQSTTIPVSAVTEPYANHDEAKPTGISKDAGNGWRKK